MKDQSKSYQLAGMMPLSEDEQRRFDEIERALQLDDPMFAAGRSLERVWSRRTVAAGAVVLIGVVLLVVGLVATQAALVFGVVISIVGFLAIVTGAAVFIRRPRTAPRPVHRDSGHRAVAAGSKSRPVQGLS